jgi:hypothetical protein
MIWLIGVLVVVGLMAVGAYAALTVGAMADERQERAWAQEQRIPRAGEPDGRRRESRTGLAIPTRRDGTR